MDRIDRVEVWLAAQDCLDVVADACRQHSIYQRKEAKQLPHLLININLWLFWPDWSILLL